MVSQQVEHNKWREKKLLLLTENANLIFFQFTRDKVKEAISNYF